MGLCTEAGHEYSSNDENLLVAISRQLATTIEKVRLYEETCRAYEDLRKTQEQLLQSEKMSAVGQLISGVAHELNNPLDSLMNLVYLLQHNDSLDSTARECVNIAEEELRRAAHVTRQMLAFHRHSSNPVPVSVPELLDDVSKLYVPLARSNGIAVVKRYEAGVTISAVSVEIRQVFGNVLRNAIEAVPPGGTVTLHVFASRERKPPVACREAIKKCPVALANALRPPQECRRPQMRQPHRLIRVPRQLFKSKIGNLPPKIIAGHILHLVRFVKHYRRIFRQYAPEIILLQRQIREKQMVIHDNQVRILRSLMHRCNKTGIEVRALLPGARIAARVQPRPQIRIIG
jgi:hypothetical protein